MSFATCNFLRDIIENKKFQCNQDYANALKYLGERGNLSKARKKVGEELTKCNQMLEELSAVSKDSHRDNPDKQQRQFWGV